MNRIRYIRKRNRLSQQQAADLMHISRKHYGRVERGQTPPSSRFLLGFSRAMNVTIGEILGEEPGRPPGNTPSEEEILSLYRSLDRNGRDFIYQELVMENALAWGSSEKD